MLVNQNKARVLVRGVLHIKGLDYHKTFLPVLELPYILIIILFTKIKDLRLRRMHAVAGFLNRERIEGFYMKQPLEFEQSDVKLVVVRLTKLFTA